MSISSNTSPLASLMLVLPDPEKIVFQLFQDGGMVDDPVKDQDDFLLVVHPDEIFL